MKTMGWGYIKKNPTNHIKIGRDMEDKDFDVYTVEEIKKLKQAVRERIWSSQ